MVSVEIPPVGHLLPVLALNTIRCKIIRVIIYGRNQTLKAHSIPWDPLIS